MEENKISTALILKYKNIVDGNEKSVKQRYNDVKLDATSISINNVASKISTVIFSPSVEKYREDLIELI